MNSPRPFLHSPGARLFSVAYDAAADGKLWCGPAVIAALTGRPLAEVRERVKAEIGRDLALEPKNGAMYFSQVTRVLADCGFDTVAKPVPRSTRITVPRGRYAWDDTPRARRFVGPTLAALARETYDDDRPLLVNVTGHFIAMHRGYYIDTGALVARPVAGSPQSRSRVRLAHWTTER